MGQRFACFFFGFGRHLLAQVLGRNFHFSYFHFGGAAHFLDKVLRFVFHLFQFGFRLGTQTGDLGQGVVAQFGSCAFSIAAQLLGIGFGFCFHLRRRDLGIHFGFSGSSLTFGSDVLAFHGSFLLQQGSLLLAVFLHFVGSFLRYDQSVLHGGFHLLIVFQLGADAFYGVFQLDVVLIQTFKILGDFCKKLIYFLGIVTAEALGKVLIVQI